MSFLSLSRASCSEHDPVFIGDVNANKVIVLLSDDLPSRHDY